MTFQMFNNIISFDFEQNIILCYLYLFNQTDEFKLRIIINYYTVLMQVL